MSYFDPWVARRAGYNGAVLCQSIPDLTPMKRSSFGRSGHGDLPHTPMWTMTWCREHAKAILDTKNAMKGIACSRQHRGAVARQMVGLAKAEIAK